LRAADNPFRTDRVESVLTFRPEWLGISWDEIQDRIKNRLLTQPLGGRCTIVGPHGSGKTTFFESLQPNLIELGHAACYIRMTRMPDGEICISQLPEVHEILNGTILLLDSAGVLRRQHRAALKQLIRKCYVIESRHYRSFSPVLLRTATRPQMLTECIKRLDPASRKTEQQIRQLFRRHRGNLRLALRECYDDVSRIG